ncbi:MAG: TMEM165/GDT1 family protein [Magnetococcales bacterium]|nr:TMEM165/GDT1 family protein [Magnetococcales bacterium]
MISSILPSASNLFEVPPLAQWFSISGTTMVVIFLAELGDKSQLVCMTLAARHRPKPVFFGALLAFVFLNILAVVFGAALSTWIPHNVMIYIVATLFGLFGVQTLLASEEDDDDEGEVEIKSGRGIFASAFLLIFIAEFGDKTQIAVAGMASAAPPMTIWLGATLALALSSGIGVLVGQRFLKRIPMNILSKVTGIFFLLLAALALTQLT